MSLTHRSRLRTYLADTGTAVPPVRNQSLVIPEQGDAVLPHTQIAAAPVRVKTDEQQPPVSTQIVLGSGWVVLPTIELITDTVVVASDGSLGTVYGEQQDYDVDYERGRLRRNPDGAIGDGASVIVWYRSYRVFDPGSDYSVQHNTGRIERLAGGALSAGQSVLVDYTPVALPVSDALLDEAVREADRQIAALVAKEHMHSSDPALASAATYLALSIVAVSLSGSALTSHQSTSGSTAWLEWGRNWREQAQQLLIPFAPAVASGRTLKVIRRGA